MKHNNNNNEFNDRTVTELSTCMRRASVIQPAPYKPPPKCIACSHRPDRQRAPYTNILSDMWVTFTGTRRQAVNKRPKNNESPPQ